MTFRSGRHFLQVPGPSNVPDRVLRAMAAPTIDHRGPEFRELAREVLDGLAGVVGTTQPVVVYPASGTGAWEAALANTLSPGDRVLMAETGHFATVWKQVALQLGLEPIFLPGDWRRGVDAAAVGGAARGGRRRNHQGGVHRPQRDVDRRHQRRPGRPPRHGRRGPSRAAAGRHHLVARLHRLPA